MSYIRKMIKRDKQVRLTVGFRAKLKEGTHWAEDFEPGRHVILGERSNESFSVLVLAKGFTGKLVHDIKLWCNSVAWIDEEDLQLVDMNLADNLSFFDWYEEVQGKICPGCFKHIVEYEELWPGCGREQG